MYFDRSHKRFLLFNITGDRNANNMLDLINKEIQFECALFTPNISSLCSAAKGNEYLLHFLILNKILSNNFNLKFFLDNMYKFSQPNRSKENAKYWFSLSIHNKSKSFSCINEAFKYLDDTYKNEQISILVTGSLHLVGEVLRSIQE